MQNTSATYQNNSFGAYLTSKNTVSNPRINYIYGFQRQEKDDEVKGSGNSINYTYRMHDPRLGRFFAVDPLAGKFPYNSPYAFSENDVIRSIELEGREKLNANVAKSKIGNGEGVKIIITFNFVQESARKESKAGMGDQDRTVDVNFNGTTRHIGTPESGSREELFVNHQRKTKNDETNDWSNKTFIEANEKQALLLSVDKYGTPSYWDNMSGTYEFKNTAVFYATNDAQTGENEKAIVKETVDNLLLHPELNVNVVGRTSKKGGDAVNLKLSQNRADKLKQKMLDYAKSGGASEEQLKSLTSRIKAVGRGSTTATGDENADNPEDRKTEIRYN